MATLASRSKLLSGLPSGTLAQHLAAISLGTGAVFTSQMTVCLETASLIIVRKPAVRDSASHNREPQTQSHDPKRNRVDIVTRPARVDVRTKQESMFVIQHRSRELLVRTLPNTVHVRRSRTVKTI